MHKYETVGNREPIVLERSDPRVDLACCDCGLVHRVTLEIGRRMVRMHLRRSDAETERLRGAERFECRPRRKV